MKCRAALGFRVKYGLSCLIRVVVAAAGRYRRAAEEIIDVNELDLVAGFGAWC